MKYRIAITTGGTGGHVYPALAVAEQFHDKADLFFIGSQYGPEAEMVKTFNIPFHGLPVRGVLGRKWKAFSALYSMIKAIVKARKILQKCMPDIVVGFGSYASFAPLVAAKLKRIPTAIHEQNVRPGLANRMLARLADRVFLSVPDTLHIFTKKSKVRYTGNPIRQSIVDLHYKFEDTKNSSTRHLLVLGGSLGAIAINSIVVDGLSRLFSNRIVIRHQTGVHDWERVKEGYALYGRTNSQVTPFIDDMAEAYQWSDLVLCRAGATTIAELAAVGKPSILIPFPYATHDHQTYNAQFLVRVGAAVLIPEKNVVEVDVIEKIIALFNDRVTLVNMALAAHKHGRIDAATCVANEIIDLLSANAMK
ncbi:undecaprenyldiphospho-muramoylpentapeptide beta-N-acetylglucosaminyltransferase [Lawsonia intracellularis]|uniref:undecaprenyldiphospho-muramoylpentapeptide beta-N-acetylglucosaminyltransferase n=1 Tax=Lawsonia intracellularis TaxID=29546 RepID=UPI000DE2E5EF|nr:undecaprenyldiphospho-muramoylpentapeptide beta-N-acetylglucosaminyltransferase [Lawsonia intracellularis]RBN35321.1 undecaprenyldiphospho-muramoylpentapeptide beta-N-acetylglucosaminyltransferase [Lawsonia intracellularis]RBN35419.1 undecaprenyldiphospho-muramoylpentapeptide beta-N-acetylglucosaminyltransferase [Lawsonia intracellularis]UYH52848.1 undecaprenyldiphospho-muramoylpentapeptide beta-N-acetylglucosaminyltransferase [Lawsonia intracellularis]